MHLHWTLRRASSLADDPGDWNALNDRSCNLPCLDSRFLVPLLELFGQGNESLAVAKANGVLVACALVAPVGLGRWSLFQPSQLPVGPLLVAGGCDVAALASSLMRSLPGLTLELGLTQLDPHLLSRSADGSTFESIDYIETAWVDVDRTFESYWEARGKNLRVNLRKARSKLEEEGTNVNFHVLTTPSDVPEAIEQYGRLERKGWKGDLGTAVDPATPQGRFYERMLRDFCSTGEGEIWQLRLGDRIVAMDLCLRRGDTLLILKTAYDVDYRALSPAFLLKQDAFRRLFEDGKTRRIEFYGRRMEWHSRWTENVRTLYHANAYRWPVIMQALRLLRRARRVPSAGGSAQGAPSSTDA